MEEHPYYQITGSFFVDTGQSVIRWTASKFVRGKVKVTWGKAETFAGAVFQARLWLTE